MRCSAFFFKEAVKGFYKLPFFELARRSPRFISSIPLRPLRAEFHVTNTCDSRCITCHHWKQKSQDELSLTELRDIFRQVKAQGITDLSILGGEPLLRDDLPDIIRAASDLKFARIHITTNGLSLTREKIERLVESGVTSLYLSINGNETVHDITRGIPGAYARTMAALKTLVALRNTRFPHLGVHVVTIIMGLTLDHIMGMVTMCHQFNIGLTLSPFHNTQPWRVGVPAKLGAMDQQQLDHLIRELHRIKRTNPAVLNDSHASIEDIRRFCANWERKDIPCYLGYLVVKVGAHGEVHPGCWPLPPVGNLRQASLEHIMGSAPYRQRASDMFLKRCPGCSCDHTINLYAHTPAIVEEIWWRLHLV